MQKTNSTSIAAEKRFKSSVACNRRCAAKSRAAAFKSCRDASNAAAAFDMSEIAQADGCININGKRFDFETCEGINLYKSNVRLLSLHVVA